MSMIAQRDITGGLHNPTVTSMTLAEVPLREVRSLQARGRTVDLPVHVRSVHHLRAFAQHVKSSSGGKTLSMVADPGLGKSTVFPLMLAKATRKIVLLVEYCNSLADCIVEGLTRVRDASDEYKMVQIVHHIDRVASVALETLIGPCVVVISARRLLGRIALGRPFPDVIALHDESHYSDYATFTWRNVSAEMPWVKTRISMSATLSPTIMSASTAFDGAKQVRYDQVIEIPPVREWIKTDALENVAVPWSKQSLAGNKTLIFSDDHVANLAYARELSAVGYKVHVLYTAALEEAVKAARLDSFKSNCTVVIFADASYRNGYNFELDTVIDCGYVREEFLDGGRLYERYRLANRIEVMQGMARVGRMKMGYTYRNDLEYPLTMPILALGEVRHAAALHIIVGFKPPQLLVDLVPEVASWDVPHAATIVRSSLDEVLQLETDASGLGTDKEDIGGEVAEPVGERPGPNSGKEGSVGLSISDVLDKARSWSMEVRHADEVFANNHPGVRYDVPRTYYALTEPYWVQAKDAERMLRKLLAEDGNYDVDMLTETEVQWFAAQITSAWNKLADEVVGRSVTLVATQEYGNEVAMHPHVVSRLQRSHRDTAMAVRGLESVMTVMREFYRKKPFAVRAREVYADPSWVRKYAGTKAEIQTAVGTRMMSTDVNDRVGGFRQLMVSRSRERGSYTWQIMPHRDRQIAASSSGTMSSNSTTSGSFRT